MQVPDPGFFPDVDAVTHEETGQTGLSLFYAPAALMMTRTSRIKEATSSKAPSNPATIKCCGLMLEASARRSRPLRTPKKLQNTARTTRRKPGGLRAESCLG